MFGLTRYCVLLVGVALLASLHVSTMSGSTSGVCASQPISSDFQRLPKQKCWEYRGA